MTPKEKAKELYAKCHVPLLVYKDGLNIKGVLLMQQCAKELSIIAVDLAMEAATPYVSQEVAFEKSREYWQQVKTEIELL